MKKWLLAMANLSLAVSLQGQANLHVLVTDQNKTPLPGAYFSLPQTNRQAETDEQGKILLENLSPGNYTFEASYLGFEDASGTLFIAEGAPAAHLDITLNEATLEFGTVLVEAIRAGKNAPFAYSMLGREAIESQNLGRDIPYLLEATPSVVATSDAGAGIGYTGLRIRGSDPTRINVTLNGIPVNDAESHNVFWVDLPDLASSVQDIQIQRGAGASTNGAGAFGASIHLNTNSLSEQPFAEFNTSIGSFGTQKISAQVGTGQLLTANGQRPTANGDSGEPWAVEARFSRILSDGYIERASVDLRAMQLSAAMVGRKNSLRFNVLAGKELTYQAWNGVPATYVSDERLRRHNVSGSEKPGTPHDNEVDDYTQTHYQLFYDHELSPAWSLGAAAHYTRGYGFFEQYKADQDLSTYGLSLCDTCCCASDNDLIRRRWLDNHFFGSILSLHYRPLGRFEAILSAAAHRYLGDHYGEITWTERGGLPQGTRYYAGTGDKLDANVFAKIQYALLPSLHGYLDLQLRRVTHELSGKDNAQRDVTQVARFLFFNPKAGLQWQWSRSLSCYASAAVAQREPNRDDFADAPPNARPLPERMLDGELGLRLKGENHWLELNFYQMTYRNQLVLTGNINDVGAPIRRNVPDSYRSGIELSGRAQVTRHLAFDGHATLSRNRIRNFTEYIDNWDTWAQETVAQGSTHLAFSPGLTAFGRWSVSPFFSKEVGSPLTLSLSGKYVGKQFMDNASNGHTALPAWFSSDFQARLKIKTSVFRELSLNLMLLNWLNAQYSANAWTYRFRSSDTSVTSDPFVRSEGNGFYNMTGFFPQAGRHFFLGATVAW